MVYARLVALVVLAAALTTQSQGLTVDTSSTQRNLLLGIASASADGISLSSTPDSLDITDATNSTTAPTTSDLVTPATPSPATASTSTNGTAAPSTTPSTIDTPPSSILSPVSDLVTPDTTPSTSTNGTAAPSTTPSTIDTPPSSILSPVTDLVTPDTTASSSTNETTASSTIPPTSDTLTPTPTSTPSSILSNGTDLLTPNTTSPPTAVTPVTLTPSTDTPVTLSPSTLTPSTLTPSTLTPSTESPSSETPETPSTKTPTHVPSSSKESSGSMADEVTESPSTETPSTKTPSTETPSTKTPTHVPSSSEESSGSMTDEVTESPAPVTAKPSEKSTESPAPVTAKPSEKTTESPAPVTNTPTVTKSPIAIEKNSGNGESQDASAQKDQTQSDVVMYNASAKPILQKSGSYNPFAIPDITSSTEKPVVLNIGDDSSQSDKLVTYVRGKTASSGSTATTNANVIGGRNTYVDTENSSVLSSSAASFHEFLRYASVAFAGISVALLLFFHFVSLDSNLLWVNAAWSPNTWEFIFYVSYLQQMQSASELTLLKSPYFLLDYSDSFAWSNFLIQESSASDSASRRLDTIVLGGIVSYADRIGISEDRILIHGVTGFAVVMGFLLAVFFVLAVMAKRKAERALDELSDLNRYNSSVRRLRSVSVRTLGLCVLVWYFSLFPLSMLSSFEISMEIQASTVADSLIVALIALVLVCFGVLAVAGRVVMHKTKDQLEQFENLATWGSLYSDYTYRNRMFFVIDVVVQVTTGVIVGCVSGDPTQLIIVMGIQALYLACVFILSPFADQMVLRITYILGLLKIVNFGLAFAFLNSNTMSATARSRAAEAFIGINSIVILVWFIRQLVVFSTYIRAWMVRSNENLRAGDSELKYNRQTDIESLGATGSRNNQSTHGATLSLPDVSSGPSSQPPYHSCATSYGPVVSMTPPAQYREQLL